MKTHFQRIASLFLAVVLSVTMVAYAAPQAAAASGSYLEVDYLPDMVTSWETTFYSWGTSVLGSSFEESYYQACWNAIDKCFAGYLGRCASIMQLRNRCSTFNYTIKEEWTKSTLLYGLASAGKYPVLTVGYSPTLDAYTLIDVNNGLILVNSVGAYAWYKAVTDPETDSFQNRDDIWLPYSTAVSKTQVSVLTKDSLSDLCVTINQTDRTCSVRDTYINRQRFYIIIDPYNNIYANADGVPYVAHYEATATDLEHDYILQEGDTINEGDTIYNDNSTIIEGATTNYEIVDNSKVIDLTNGIFNYIGEQSLDQYYIDELLLDTSSKTYSADTYNVTYDNDTYNTSFYTWNITYNITNTYVTNIGQTELYKPLELYYALPDGRSSADLTAEEIAGMSFEFADCVNYAKSATDTYLRALYHFDGNTDDSSYFSTQGKFEWVEGASIEYMDVGTFNGALYLGPESHQFKITLPSNIGSGDFSLQFRYYQAGAADTQSNVENYVSIGGTTVLQWDEGSIYNGAGVLQTSLAVGTWQELAVIRHNGVLYLYHNGLCIGGTVNISAWNSEIVVGLGATTRAYSMIDELRVINFAHVETGYSYTPTSVPYDTNAVLVLPDSAFPIADEYWDIKSSNTNLLSAYGLDKHYSASSVGSNYWTSASISFSDSNLAGETLYDTCYMESSSIGTSFNCSRSSLEYFCFPYWTCSSPTSLLFTDNGLVVSAENWPSSRSIHKVLWGSGIDPYLQSTEKNYVVSPGAGLFTRIGDYREKSSGSSDRKYYGVTAGKEYTFSVVLSDGQFGSVSFKMPTVGINTCSSGSTVQLHTSAVSMSKIYYYTDVGPYRIGLFRSMCYETYSGYRDDYYLYIAPIDRSAPSVGIIYIEFAESSSTDLTAEWVTCMYSSEEVKPNTAAIQTDIPINGYTVGGVRPTFPSRGDVWMPVTNNRISGVYVYNGSAWEEVNARWYTGTRWIPIYGFDLTTLEDCWDIADGDTTISSVATEQEFWNWWKRAWLDFREWFSGNVGGGSGVSEDILKENLPDEENILDDPDTEEDESQDGYSIIDLASGLIGGIWRVVKGVVSTSVDGITGIVSSVTYISDFFSFYDENGEMHGIVNYGGDDIWD